MPRVIDSRMLAEITERAVAFLSFSFFAISLKAYMADKTAKPNDNESNLYEIIE